MVVWTPKSRGIWWRGHNKLEKNQARVTKIIPPTSRLNRGSPEKKERERERERARVSERE
jgi:hypothetical protein